MLLTFRIKRLFAEIMGFTNSTVFWPFTFIYQLRDSRFHQPNRSLKIILAVNDCKTPLMSPDISPDNFVEGKSFIELPLTRVDTYSFSNLVISISETLLFKRKFLTFTHLFFGSVAISIALSNFSIHSSPSISFLTLKSAIAKKRL